MLTEDEMKYWYFTHKICSIFLRYHVYGIGHVRTLTAREYNERPSVSDHEVVELLNCNHTDRLEQGVHH